MKLGLHDQPNKRVEITKALMTIFDIPANSYHPDTLERIPGVADTVWEERFKYEAMLQNNKLSKWTIDDDKMWQVTTLLYLFRPRRYIRSNMFFVL
jgi:hypothetical protein